MTGVIIGVDPHKLSATLEVVDQHGNLLGPGCFGSDKVGYTAMRAYVRISAPVSGGMGHPWPDAEVLLVGVAGP